MKTVTITALTVRKNYFARNDEALAHGNAALTRDSNFVRIFAEVYNGKIMTVVEVIEAAMTRKATYDIIDH